MTATLRSMRINHGGTTNAHGACTVRYGTSTIHGGSRRDQSWGSVAKPWMIRRTTVHSSWWIVRVCGVKDSTVSLRSSKIGYDLSRIAANIATVSVRISTIPLRLRYELGHAQLPPRFATVRHECFKQFKTSVALP